MIGKTLAHYEITALVGRGGMGEVYRARDTKLGREVALKIIPRELSGDRERAARFAREARTLASLHHPNVASIFGFEEVDGVQFLVMELVEGEDLSVLLARERMATDDALRIALQLAKGMEVAHGKGIVHRDLKPANVKVGADGTVKILDFGLARAYVGDAIDGGDPDHSPTITAAMTGAGVILGTAAYMSPEQARGRPTDNRADIWAFGVILFETLSGERLFAGETISDTLASVLKTEVDWSLLPADLPPRVRALLVRCLDRDRNRRLRDVGEARITLEDELSGAPDVYLESALHSGLIPVTHTASTGSRIRRTWLAVATAAIVGVLLGLVGSQVVPTSRSVEIPVRKLALASSTGDDTYSLPVISPDGRAVAYLTSTHIVVREMNARETRTFAVDEMPLDLFWSPDGRSLAYVGRNRIVRLDALSGQRQVVCEARGRFGGGSGGTWGDDGTIVFTQADTLGFFRVSERGGDPRQILAIDASVEQDFHDPYHLPGGRGLLFAPHRLGQDFSSIDLWTEDGRKNLITLEGQTLANPVYSPTGHVLFRRSPTNPGIWAVPFSLERLEVTGEPFLAAPRGSAPSIANDGTLVYLDGTSAASLRLTWNDASGREIASAGEIRFGAGYTFPASDFTARLACASVDEETNPDLWVFDRSRDSRSRLTFGEGREEWPVWTPSGDAVLYHIRPTGYAGIDSMRVLRIPADGTGRPDTLAVGFIPAVSPDGQFFTVSMPPASGGWLQADLGFAPLTGERLPTTRLAEASGLQMDGQIAPGGAYVAYASDESGRFEVYLTRFPSGQGRWQVSTDGGLWSRWNARGDRLYYARENDIMAVDVALGDVPILGRPELLVSRSPLSITTVAAWAPGFDVRGDGDQFLYFRDVGTGATEREIVVVQNWYGEFETQD